MDEMAMEEIAAGIEVNGPEGAYGSYAVQLSEDVVFTSCREDFTREANRVSREVAEATDGEVLLVGIKVGNASKVDYSVQATRNGEVYGDPILTENLDEAMTIAATAVDDGPPGTTAEVVDLNARETVARVSQGLQRRVRIDATTTRALDAAEVLKQRTAEATDSCLS